MMKRQKDEGNRMLSMTRRNLLQGVAAMGVLSVAGLRTAFAQVPEDTKALYEAAKQEGTLTYYATAQAPITKRVTDRFSELYPGIKINVLRLATGQMAQRFASELQAGNVVADVIQMADPLAFEDAAKAGWLAKPGDLPAWSAFPKDYLTEHWALMGISPHTIVSNTDLVDAKDYPKDWKVMLEPRFKGQLILSDPRNNMEVADWAYTMFEAYGADFLTGLRAQQPRFVESILPGIQMLAAGEAMILAPALHQATMLMMDKKAPVIDFSPAMTSGQETMVGVVAKAPHPNAARLLANFLLTRDGQERYCRDIAASPLPDIPGALTLSPQYQRGRYRQAAAKRAELAALLGLS